MQGGKAREKYPHFPFSLRKGNRNTALLDSHSFRQRDIPRRRSLSRGSPAKQAITDRAAARPAVGRIWRGRASLPQDCGTSGRRWWRNSRPATRFRRAERLRRTAAPENREDRQGLLVRERPANARTDRADIRLAPQARGLPPARLRAREMNSSWPMTDAIALRGVQPERSRYPAGFPPFHNEAADRLCGLSRKADFRKRAA